MKRMLALVLLLFGSRIALAAEPVKIDSRRELFVDDALVERIAGRAELRLHQPTPREVALVTAESWEGNGTNYVTVFQDGDKYRMYYRGSHYSYLGGKDRPNTRDLIETKSAIEDAPPEISFYATEHTLQENGAALRRYSLRVDGFVSLHAPLVGGELTTKPLTFAGNQLTLNVSTSAAGSVRVEIQNSDGEPFPGFSLADCDAMYGDGMERTVVWKGNPGLGAHAGKPVRLRFELKDSDVFSYQFRKANP